MDPTDRLEIYIPVEAEVKNIPLLSLPSSVLRRIPLPDTKGSRKLAGSPECTWICPVVVRRKGQKPAAHAGNSVVENMSSQLCREFQAAPGPLRMSFVSPNRAAFKMLKEMNFFTSGKKVSTHRSQTSLLSQGQQTNQTAVVIYRGSIYLSIRKPRPSKGKQGTRDPQSAARSSIPSASLPKSQKKELQNVNRPKKKHTTCAVTHSENIVTHKVRDVSSSKTAHSVPQSTESEPGGEQEAVAIKDCGECQFQDLGRQEAESTTHNSDMDSDMQINSGEISNQSCSRRQPLGAACASTSPVKEYDFTALAQEEKITRMKARLRQNEAESASHNSDMDSIMQINSGEISNQSCSRRQPLGAACASTSPVKEYDFTELAQEEKIARMKARLRQNEAERASHNSDMDSIMQIDSGEISNQSCSRRQPLGAACASTSPVKEYDFTELAQEEKIARMKARLRQNEAESASHNSDMDSIMQIDSGEISNQSCSRRQPLSATFASTSLAKEYDFTELAQEEKIARMKARLRQNEAAVNNLPSS